jgi:hypothetical protein
MSDIHTKTKSIFDFLNCLFEHKTKWDELSESDKKAFSPYIINKFISMHQDFVGIVNYLQQYNMSGMRPKEVYKLYLDLLPRQKFFSKYIKSKKETNEKISENLVGFLSKQEKWSTDEAFDNISFLLSTNGGNEILVQYLNMFGITREDAKKVYKIN